MRKNIKRVIAGLLTAMLMLSLVNLPALSLGLASEPSGYEVGVEYSEDNTSATLVGDTTGLKEGVQLDKLVDSEGQELDPYGLYQTVEENGTYHFTLYYQETVDTQDADQPTTEEKTQELEVVVNGIGKPKADQPQQPEVQEGIVMGGEAEKDGPPPFAEKEDSMTAAPRTVPLDVLQRSMAQARASKNVHIYANEAEYKLKEVAFNGGPLVANAAGLPSVDNRTFVKAVYVENSSGISREINGLYSYDNKWYYTVAGNTVDGGAAGTINMGFLLPDNTTVRLHYKVTDTQNRTLNFTSSNDLANDFKLSINGTQTYTNLQYPRGAKVILEFQWPVTLKGFNIKIPGVGTFDINNAQKLGSNTLTENKIWETSDQWYTLVFTMPPQKVDATFNGTKWTDADKRSYAIGSDFTPGANETLNDTNFQGNPSDHGSFFRSISYHQTNSPGMVKDASVSHNGSNMSYTSESSFQVYTNGGTTTKSMRFATGEFKSGQMVGFELRMDRKTNDYTWKPNALVLDVYIGQQYNSTNKNFHQYTIQMAQDQAGILYGTRKTYLDCGAWVQTVCYQWDENAYYYKIYVYNMTHNFKLYDRPGKTNQENFSISKMDGISTGVPGSTSTSGVSFASDQNTAWSGGAPIHPNDDFQRSWIKGADVNSIVQKYFFIRPKYGYTSPKHKISDTKYPNTHMASIGQIEGMAGTYQFTLQAMTTDTYTKGNAKTKAATTIEFWSEPITFNVGYYANNTGGNAFYNPEYAMTATKNSYYTIEQKTQGSQQLKGYKVVANTSFYQNSQLKSEAVVIPPPNDPNNTEALWYPNIGIISFTRVYDYLQSKGKVPQDASVTLRIVPVYLANSENPVQARWELKEQTKFANLDNNTTDNRNLTENVNATSTKKNINAYVGSTVSLYGNKKQYQKGTKKYLYNETASRPVGTVTAENPIVASLEYVLATSATVDTGTLGTGHNYASWKSNIEGKWFTSIGNFNHIIDIGTLDPGTKNGMIFDGWQIRAGDATVKVNENTMVWNDTANGKKYLSLAKIGREESTLWSKIFDNGTFALEATWRSNIEPIKNAQGTTSLVTNNPVYVVSNDTTGFEISGVFKYGTKTVVNGTAGNNQVTLSEIQQKITNNNIKLVVLKKPGNAGTTPNPWQLWYSENAAQNNSGTPFPIERQEISVDSSGGFKVTFKVKENSPINLDYENGAVYRIFAWSEANGTTSQNLSGLTGAQLQTAMNNTDNAKLTLIPCTKTEVFKLEKITSDGTNVSQTSNPVKGIQLSSRDGFEITASFMYGNKTVVSGASAGDNQILLSEIQRMITNGDIKLVVAKKPAQIDDATAPWKLWYSENRAQANSSYGDFPIGNPQFSVDGGKFRVTFKVNENSNLNETYEDGAIYRIFAWTAANGNGDHPLGAFTGAQLQTVLNQNQAAKLALIPSVETRTVVLRKITLDGSSTGSQANDALYIVYNDTSGVQITASFKYGNKAVVNGEATAKSQISLTDIQQLIASGDIKLVVTKLPIKPDTPWKLWYSENRAQPNGNSTFPIANPQFSVDGGKFKVTFKINEGSNLDKTYEDGAIYRIFSWTVGNNNNGQELGDVTGRGLLGELNSPSSAKLALIPSMTTTTYLLFKVTNSGGTSITNATENKEVYSETPYTLTASFRYGDNAADQAKLQKLFENGQLKIVLLKKDPKIGDDLVSWEDQYGGGQQPFGEPTITKETGSDDFTVSFTVSKNVTGQENDGAQFRILVWTDANGTKNGNAYTATDIMDSLKDATGDENPFDTIIPSRHINVSMVYKVIGEGEATSTVTVLSTSSNIPLTTTFKYNYDTARYPNGFTGDLSQLIADEKITAALKYQKKDETDWTSQEVTSANVLSASDNGKGVITFTYQFAPGGDLSTFDGAQFKIQVQSVANGSAPAEHTITVTYVSDPSAYVEIPKYVILEDGNTNLDENEYAGKQVVVKYKESTDTTTRAAIKPDITVKVESDVPLHEGSINGPEMSNMTIGIYDLQGTKLEPPKGEDYSTIGTLTSSSPDGGIFFWMNVKRGTEKNQQYYATVRFMLELAGTMT